MLSRSLLRSGFFVAFASLSLTALSACGGGGGSSNFLGSGNAQVRFVNGSSGAGNVDVVIDGTAKFSNAAFATATNYLSLTSGTHSLTVYPAGQESSGSPYISNQVFSVNSGAFETLALGGKTPSAVYTVSDQVFSGTYNGYGAVNFYNFSPAIGANQLQFGYYVNPSSASSTPTLTGLGSAVTLGTASQPVGVPTSVAIGFGAAAGGSTTALAIVKPSQIDPTNCAANTFACNSGLLSVFAIDAPNGGAELIGIFNATGT